MRWRLRSYLIERVLVIKNFDLKGVIIRARPLIKYGHFSNEKQYFATGTIPDSWQGS